MTVRAVRARSAAFRDWLLTRQQDHLNKDYAWIKKTDAINDAVINKEDLLQRGALKPLVKVTSKMAKHEPVYGQAKVICSRTSVRIWPEVQICWTRYCCIHCQMKRVYRSHKS